MVVFLYFAFVFFVLATFFSDAWGVPANAPFRDRLSFNMIAAGLALFIASLIWTK